MKVLWAIEPFNQDLKRIQEMHHLLEQLVENPTDIEVGYIVTRTESEFSMALNVPKKERFSIYPKKFIKKTLSKAKISIDERNIHVVDYETLSNTKAVDRFLSLAKTRKSDLIALYTHARHGLKRLTMGSFAETAVHRSKISLLLVNPKTKITSRIKEVLFSTDFKPESEKHLTRVIELCKKIGAGLTIFHQAEVIYKWSLDESNPKILAYRRKVDRTKARIMEVCNRAGLNHKIVIASEFSPTTDLILDTTIKAKADLIVVSAKSGPLLALMGGSVTRQIIRSSSKPVLVLKD